MRSWKKAIQKLIEYRMARKDGGLIWVQDRGQLMRREDGREVFYCILLDITETKKGAGRICAFRWNATKSLWIRPTTLFLSGRSNRIH